MERTNQEWIELGQRHLERYQELAARPVCHCEYGDVVSGKADSCPVKVEYRTHNYQTDHDYFISIVAGITRDIALLA